MKTRLLLLHFLLAILTGSMAAQPDTIQTITDNGMFDHVSDRFGNQYPLVNLALNAARPLSSSNYSTSSVPTNSCSAGYFDLYFAPGSYFDGNSTAANVLCEVFKNITGFIQSPLSAFTNTVRISIYCNDNTAPGGLPGALAAASGFVIYPYNPVNPNGGIIQNQIQKALLSGQDPFANLSISLFTGANNFYSGYIYIDGTASWNLNMGITTIGATDHDLYTVLLHEATHSLGFTSYMSQNGVSQLGSSNNYFSCYDQFLVNSSGTSLLAGPTPACNSSSLTFQTSTTAITPSNCIGAGSDLTNCSTAAKYSSPNVTVTVYTPSCWELGSSLSHFEDMCTVPGTFTTSCVPTPTSPGYNNLYYVMCNATGTGSCSVKRHLKPEERYVLCDLGYSVSTTYTSSALSASVNYGGTSCNGPGLWGMHDGLSGGNLYTYTTTGASFSIPTSSLLINDSPNATQISCVEVIYGPATVSVGSGSLSVTSSTGAGLIVVKYLPANSTPNQFGNATYVYIFFVPVNCSVDPCNLVQNPGFESITPTSTASCGQLPFDCLPSCWFTEGIYSSPDLFTRGCSSYYNLGTSTFNFSIAVNSHNGAPNDRVLGFSGSTYITESFKSDLSAPLINGQTYQFSVWLYQSNQSFVNLTLPTTSLVVSFCADVSLANTLPLSVYPPPNIPVIAEFTVPPGIWTQFTNTFVFAPTTTTVNHNVLIVGINGLKTSAYTGTVPVYCFIDDLSLVPISGTSPSFFIPQGANCGNITFTNLAQYANFPGTFSGTGVTSTTSGTLTTYNFNSPASLPSGIYPVAFTYTNNGCVNTISQNIILGSPSFTYNAIGDGVYCQNLYPSAPAVTLSAISSNTNVSFTWEPGNLSGATVTVTPSSSQIYTISAFGNCLLSSTLAVGVSTTCCTSTVSPLTASTLSTYSLTGPLAINADITVPAGQALLFAGGAFQIAPSVKITVNGGGASLIIKQSHLYACGSSMWQGIIVKDGGSISVSPDSYDNLIEDAITAVDISGHTTSTLSSILAVDHTTFNKNYVDINISSYQRSSSSYPFVIKSCVFTCRNFTFTPTTWPQASVTTGCLREASALTPTTDLAPPYALLSAGITNLKSPYSSRPSQTAIQINSVGVTGSGNYYGAVIGTTTNASDFNLFDAHGYFISAVNSNIKSWNNVFQNTQRYVTLSGFGFSLYDGGSAINNNVNNDMNAFLDLGAANVNVGNRFWNCHHGVNSINLYRFRMTNAILRSTQSSTLLPGGSTPGYYTPGSCGVFMTTDRVGINMLSNEFTNLNTGFYLGVSAGTYTVSGGGQQSGIYAANLTVEQNTFSPLLPTASSTVIGTNYMNQAIYISSPNSFSWTTAPDGDFSSIIGTFIEYNDINRVFDGISINGLTDFPSTVDNNTVTLEDDNVFGFPQNGIIDMNTNGTHKIWGNYTQGSNSTSTNSLVSLICCNLNSGVYSPSVSCNITGHGFNGFEFVSSNSGAIWAGNLMNGLGRGLVITNGGVIGTQGSNVTASDNQWQGSSWTGTNCGTWVGPGSNATLSPLWIKTGQTIPPNNSGTVTNTQRYGAANTLSTSAGGLYSCVGIPNNRSIPIPASSNYTDVNQYYIAQTALYRLLWANDSVRNSAPTYTTFYSGLASASPSVFLHAEKALYGGDYATAASLVSGLTTTNTVESNYKSYYTIYATYMGSGSLNSTDSTTLYNLTQLCPADNGACIHQARALYRNIYRALIRFPETCNEYNARLAKFPAGQSPWNVLLFPNPSNGRFTLQSTVSEEILHIQINDLSGRTIRDTEVNVSDFIANLDLSLLNGVYLVKITNRNYEILVKKLLIDQ